MRGRSLFLFLTVWANVSGVAACSGESFTVTCEDGGCVQEEDADTSTSDAGHGGDAGPCDETKGPDEEPCTIDERFAVFVSPRGNDSDGRGDRETPFRTLARAVEEAVAAGKRVYACEDGTGYQETLVLTADQDGLVVYGGFECDGWTYARGKALLRPAVPDVPLRIDGLRRGLYWRDFVIRAANATEAGASSIGVLVNASSGVVFESVDVFAGKGKAGANGTSVTVPAAAGTEGNAGSRACTSDPNPGGAAANLSCGGTATTGGRGGDGGRGINSAGNGNPGLPTSMGGGQEGFGAGSSRCQPGWDGASGAAGEPGAGGNGIGTLSATGWTGVDGQPGSPGSPGQGGGGGGGAKAPAVCEGMDTPTGASGGSGGAGGCGGMGGGGGKAGGSSIALASIDSEVTLRDCTLAASDGGRGGKGAAGQKGGVGGSGGIGGQGANGSSAACSGGNGGKGGDGGPGGGGAGGHSIGVAYVGTKPNRSGGSITLGTPGVGGAPGSGTDGRGVDGVKAEELEF